MKRNFILNIFVVTIFKVSLSLEMNKTFDGYFSFYNYGGFGACGNLIDAGSQKFVAVSSEWFKAAEINDDVICKKCLKIKYNGKM